MTIKEIRKDLENLYRKLGKEMNFLDIKLKELEKELNIPKEKS